MAFKSAEHANHCTGAMRLNEPNLVKMILRAKSGKEAKKLAYEAKSNDAWDKAKIDVMRTIISEKFMQNPTLCGKLVESGQTNFIEATLDGFWGARASFASKSIKQGTWSGANFLGKILAETRTELRRELGLPNLCAENVSNAPTAMELSVEPPTTPAPPAPSTALTKTSNQGQQTMDKQTPKQSGFAQPADLTQRSNRKNKEHQSPIPSPTSNQLNSNKKKKARVFSPKSELPPGKQIADLFALAPLDQDDLVATVSMV